MITEEQAKTKRCHEGFAASPGASRNPDIDHAAVFESAPVSMVGMPSGYGSSFAAVTTTRPMTAPIFCLGSSCMAWRWAGAPPPENRVEGETNPNWVGYCGKAGKP